MWLDAPRRESRRGASRHTQSAIGGIPCSARNCTSADRETRRMRLPGTRQPGSSPESIHFAAVRVETWQRREMAPVPKTSFFMPDNPAERNEVSRFHPDHRPRWQQYSPTQCQAWHADSGKRSAMTAAPDRDRYALCPTCQANRVEPPPRLIVLNSRIRAGTRIQYLGCTRCGFRPPENKRIIPLSFAPPQPHRAL